MSMHIRRSRAGIAKRGITALLAVVVPAGIALSASLDISPSSGAAGRQVTLSSSGFDQDGIGYNTAFRVAGSQIAACPFDNRANCSVQVNLPFAAPGPQQVTASNSAGETASKTYTVAEPHFYLEPACGSPGDTVTAQGKFFAIGSDAGIKFDGAYVATNNYPDNNGSFSASFVVPAVQAGTYAVTVQNSAGNAAFSDLTVPCAVVGQVDDLTGPVYRCIANCGAPNPADRTRVPVNRGDPVRMGDRFETDQGARLNLGFADNTQFTLSERTRIEIDEYVYDAQSNRGSEGYSLLEGGFRYLSGLVSKPKEDYHEVQSPYGSIGIRGTWFVTRRDDVLQRQEVYLSTGQVDVTPDGTGLPSTFYGPVTIVFDANGVSSSPFVDTESDGVADPVDNCTAVANPTQLDADGDGYGNACDGDLNNSGLVTATDFNLLRSCLNQPATASALCAAADMNGSGLVTSTDFNLLRARLNSAPGPSGLH